MNFPQYLVHIHNRLMAGEATKPLVFPEFPPALVGHISRRFGLLFIPEKAAEGNVCLANVEEVRPEYRSTFSSTDLLNYIYALSHTSSYLARFAKAVECNDFDLLIPKDAPNFWWLAETGGYLRQLHLLESPLLEAILYPFPLGGSNMVTEPKFMLDVSAARGTPPVAIHATIGRIYINDNQYFDGVPLSIWNYQLGVRHPAQEWLVHHKSQPLSRRDIRDYQKLLHVVSETDLLVSQIAAEVSNWS